MALPKKEEVMVKKDEVDDAKCECIFKRKRSILRSLSIALLTLVKSNVLRTINVTLSKPQKHDIHTLSTTNMISSHQQSLKIHVLHTADMIPSTHQQSQSIHAFNTTNVPLSHQPITNVKMSFTSNSTSKFVAAIPLSIRAILKSFPHCSINDHACPLEFASSLSLNKRIAHNLQDYDRFIDGNNGTIKGVVMVVHNGKKELSTNALEWTLTHIAQDGDNLNFVVVHHSTSMSTLEADGNSELVEKEIKLRESCYKRRLHQFSEVCESKGVKFNITFKAGPCQPQKLLLAEAISLRAAWVIIDRNMKGGKKFLSQKLLSNVLFIKDNTNVEILCLDRKTSYLMGASPSHSVTLTEILPQRTNFTNRYVTNYTKMSSSHGQPNDSNVLEEISSCSKPSLNHHTLPLVSDVGKKVSIHSIDVKIDARISRGRTCAPLTIKPPPLCSICKHVTPLLGARPHEFKYEELHEATSNFSSQNVIAEGKYGYVYQGTLKDGQVIAIEVLKSGKASQSATDFFLEVQLLSRIHHKNLISLLGYCIDPRMLAYEYVCNGSLHTHLSEGRKKQALDWHSRYKIALGTAAGLRYLHEECFHGSIVHHNICSANILLTHDFNPMIVNFGSTSYHLDHETKFSSKTNDGFGYLGHGHGCVPNKIDIFAFGVLLLELLIGKSPLDLQGNHNLIDWVYPYLNTQSIDLILDPTLGTSTDPCELMCVLNATRQCIDRDTLASSNLTKILHILEDNVYQAW